LRFDHCKREQDVQAQLSRTLACGIAVMAKASARGQAKTRLAPPLTLDEAAEFNTAFLRDIADNLLAAGSQAPIQGLIAFGPPGSEDFFTAIMPREIKLMECWFPDFGACLLHAMSSILREGYASGVVLNADSPTLPAAYLAEAAQFLALPGDRAVLGPSSDGGYYLLGLKEPHRRLFEDIAWSTERVAEQTIERAREIDLPMHVLPTWYDIDDCESLRTLHDELFENHCYSAASQASPAHHTKALMQRLLADADLARRVGFAARSQSRPVESRAVRAALSPR
jgi:rSAM/selenodomain-associated transferase 1